MQALNYYYDLFFPVEGMADVLLDVGRLCAPDAGAGAHASRTNLVLADGRMVTLPFSSWYGDHKTILLGPGTKVRLDARLFFPPDEALRAFWAQRPPGKLRPLYIRLWVFAGERYVKFSFFAPNTRISTLFLTSTSIRDQFSRLLAMHGGLFGTLDVDRDVVYLLPDLETCLQVPNILDYYGQGLEVFDVDRWVADLSALGTRPTPPPEIDLSSPEQDLSAEAAIEALAGRVGSWREPVPRRYHRTFEDRPFDACDFCARPLLVPHTQYTITKLFVDGDLSQEIAICLDCTNKLAEGYSAESWQTLNRTFGRVPWIRRLGMAADSTIDRAERMTSRCLLCEAPNEESAAYFEYAHCEANEIIYAVYPHTICDHCTLRLHDSLSAKTKEERRRFYDEHFGFSPPGSPARERVDETLNVWILS